MQICPDRPNYPRRLLQRSKSGKLCRRGTWLAWRFRIWWAVSKKMWTIPTTTRSRSSAMRKKTLGSLPSCTMHSAQPSLVTPRPCALTPSTPMQQSKRKSTSYSSIRRLSWSVQVHPTFRSSSPLSSRNSSRSLLRLPISRMDWWVMKLAAVIVSSSRYRETQCSRGVSRNMMIIVC